MKLLKEALGKPIPIWEKLSFAYGYCEGAVNDNFVIPLSSPERKGSLQQVLDN